MMRIRTILPALTAILFCAVHLGAQAVGAPAPAGKAPGGNSGVNPVRQIDRPDVRVSRVELAVGAVRAVHQHDEAKFHLFIPLTGTLELTIGSDKPVVATPGQAFYLLKGTPHGFRNIGSTPASVMEVFVLLDKPATGQQAPSAQVNGPENSEEAATLAQAFGAVLARPAVVETPKH
jgi:quercetin dioxygenase-like cupin family protein